MYTHSPIETTYRNSNALLNRGDMSKAKLRCQVGRGSGAAVLLKRCSRGGSLAADRMLYAKRPSSLSMPVHGNVRGRQLASLKRICRIVHVAYLLNSLEVECNWHMHVLQSHGRTVGCECTAIERLHVISRQHAHSHTHAPQRKAYRTRWTLPRESPVRLLRGAAGFGLLDASTLLAWLCSESSFELAPRACECEQLLVGGKYHHGVGISSHAWVAWIRSSSDLDCAKPKQDETAWVQWADVLLSEQLEHSLCGQGDRRMSLPEVTDQLNGFRKRVTEFR